MTDLGEVTTEYNGVVMKIKDIPDEFIRTMLGYGHVGWRSRQVIDVEGRTWETTPDKCTYGSNRWEWVGDPEDNGDPQYLVCPKCGVDGT